MFLKWFIPTFYYGVLTLWCAKWKILPAFYFMYFFCHLYCCDGERFFFFFGHTMCGCVGVFFLLFEKSNWDGWWMVLCGDVFFGDFFGVLQGVLSLIFMRFGSALMINEIDQFYDLMTISLNFLRGFLNIGLWRDSKFVIFFCNSFIDLTKMFNSTR